MSLIGAISLVSALKKNLPTSGSIGTSCTINELDFFNSYLPNGEGEARDCNNLISPM